MNALENQFFRDFSAAGRDALLPHLKVEGFQNGIYLFHEGDPPDGVYLLLEGEIEVLKQFGRREQALAVFKPGEFLGEAAVLDGLGRSTGARARGHVVVVKVPTGPLMEVLAREPLPVTIRLFQRVLTYFRRTNDLYVREVVHKEKLTLVGEMAASLMHDLRNPLSGIRLAADLMRMIHQDEESLRCCEGIALQCDRITAMAADLLDASRGEIKLHLERTDAAALLERFRVLNAEYLRSASSEIVFKAEPAEIEVDVARLLRLLQNLVSNAAEATSRKADGRVDVEAWVENARFLILVKDNGPGLPEAVVERMYEPFSTHGKEGGTGLGMTIVKKVVDAHGGKISFKTARGLGTSFLVELPQASVEKPAEEAPAESRLGPEAGAA